VADRALLDSAVPATDGQLVGGKTLRSEASRVRCTPQADVPAVAEPDRLSLVHDPDGPHKGTPCTKARSEGSSNPSPGSPRKGTGQRVAEVLEVDQVNLVKFLGCTTVPQPVCQCSHRLSCERKPASKWSSRMGPRISSALGLARRTLCWLCCLKNTDYREGC